MKRTRLAGLHYWSAFQPDHGIDFNGFLWTRASGNLLIDPLPAGDAERARADDLGGARWIVVTNADHWRAADAWAERTGAGIVAPAAERERLGERAARVTGWFENAGQLPADLRDDIAVHEIAGGKSPREVALYLQPLRTLLFGDIVRSTESGRLCLLPEAKLQDGARVRRDLLALRDVQLDALLLGDGDSLFTGARGAWLDFLRTLGRDVADARTAP